MGAVVSKKSVAFVMLFLAFSGLATYFATRPLRVSTARASRGPIVATIVASGRVQPASRVALGFEAMGTVESVSVSEGAQVRRGELLVQLDDSSARAAVEQARAKLSEVEASLARVRGLGTRVADVDVRSAELALEAARERERRERDLVAGGATTAVAVDDASRAVQAAEAALARVTEQRRGLGRGGEEARVVLAAREGAQAALRAAQSNLDRTSLRAPFDGVVLSRRVEPGQVVQPGATVLELASSGPSEVVLNADESHLAWLALGQRADVSAESFPDRRFVGEVAAIAPSVDPLRGTIEVKLRLPNPPEHLRPDMTVSVEIETARSENALLLPSELVHDLASEQPWVWIVRRGVVERRALRLGLRGDEQVSVVSGITASDDIVRGDADAVGAGQRVRVRVAGGR